MGAFILAVVTMAGAAAPVVPIAPLDPAEPFVPEGRPLEGLVITLDAGHGGHAHQAGYAGSARGINTRVVEGDINLLVAAQLRWHLQMAGATVHMTRWDDRRVTLNPPDRATVRAEELGARLALAEATRSHLFLSLHHNSSPRRTAHGVMILIWPTDKAGRPQPLEVAFADLLREEVEKTVPTAERFSHYVVDHPLASASDIPSAVVEYGFLSNPDFDAWVVTPGAHRKEAIGTYNAIVRMWTEHRAGLEELRTRLFPDSTPVTPAPPRDEFAAIFRSLWPAGTPVATAADANRLLSLWRATRLSDATNFHVRTAVTRRDDGTWVLDGAASHPLLREAAARLLAAAGCTPLENQIRQLPAPELGEARWGITRVPFALTWGEPREHVDVQTSLLLGEPVHLLDIAAGGDYYLVQGIDGYTGWVRRDAVRRMTREEFDGWRARPRARLLRDVMVDDFRLPVGAVLPAEPAADQPGMARVLIPAPVRATGMTTQTLVPMEALTMERGAAAGVLAAEAARTFLGAPYVFGGRSVQGVDCSGLNSAAWSAAGITIPRDARQQVMAGELVAPWSHRGALRPGDLVFFLDETGKVFHTGIAMGGGVILHSSPPEVHLTSIEPGHPHYSEFWATRYAFSRRIVP
jgi:N-acetylmuramoyl-L-alanine amidase